MRNLNLHLRCPEVFDYVARARNAPRPFSFSSADGHLSHVAML